MPGTVRAFRIALTIIALVSVFRISANADSSPKNPSRQKLPEAQSALVTAANQHRTSIEALLPHLEGSLKQAAENLEKRRELLEKGIVSKLDVTAAEEAVKNAQAEVDKVKKQLVETDHLIAEAQIVEVPRKTAVRSVPAISRSNGSSGWVLSRAAQVKGFFSSKFGRELPISAFGQTATHDRLRFAHHNSIDVAVHPDSVEGQALIAYLRSSSIPYLAFRSAIKGVATGAHIHIGYASHRIN
jgi:hypothetical protein